MTGPGFRSGEEPPSGREFQPGRLYLGWQYALLHADPGPSPRRPVPPQPPQLDAAGLAGLAALPARSVWRGERALRAAVAAEKQRVAAARAATERRLFAWQEEHARRFREWQQRRAAFARQPHWYGVTVPRDIDRVDVAGGTLAGWSAMLTTVAMPRLAAGGEVTVLDLTEGTVAADLIALARRSGIGPLVWVLPGDLPRLDLGAGLPGAALADVLALSAAGAGSAGAGSAGAGAAGQEPQPDAAHDAAILQRVLEVLGAEAGMAAVSAALRALAQVGDPREDLERGLLTAAQLEQLAALYGRTAASQVVTQRAWQLEARLRVLEPLGSATAALPASPLRVLALDRGAGMTGAPVLGSYLTVALTQLIRQAPRGEPWQHTLCLAGAERLRGEVLDRLCHACEATRTGLVLAYRGLPGPVRERLGRGNAAVAFMRLGNAEDAKAASEQIGTEHRFVVSQLTDTVGSSVTVSTGDSYTSTVSLSGSAGLSGGTTLTTGHSRGRGHSQAGLAPFAPLTASGSRDRSSSRAVSDTISWSEGISASTSWGISTSSALGENESLARTAQRSREFLVEASELQQLPPSAAIVTYASHQGRQVVLADVNPGILALPVTTTAGVAEAAREDARERARREPGEQPGDGAGGRAGQDPGGAPGHGAGEQAKQAAGQAEQAAGQAEQAAGGQARRAAGNRTGQNAGDQTAQAGQAGERPGQPATAPAAWRAGEGVQPPPNLGPPPEPLDWRG